MKGLEAKKERLLSGRKQPKRLNPSHSFFDIKSESPLKESREKLLSYKLIIISQRFLFAKNLNYLISSIR